ncbi:thioredoxin domain-containing protein [Aneurinibacillus aneurinilyticus]|uniref:thioredoxin domain-containing protein n=1 Tax=Aneurinibacillus aneurinilyticus TaxID=1391 RepID=UPI003F9BA432
MWNAKSLAAACTISRTEFLQNVCGMRSGNFEHHKSIPNLVDKSLEQSAQEAGMELDELKQFIEKCRVKLFEVREKRMHPHKDDKILTAWNGLMIAALARGSVVLGDGKYAEAAARAVEFVKNKLLREDGRLLARYRDGESAFLGYLDDYAFLIWGLLELYEATFETDYLMYAMNLQEQQFTLFWDKEDGGFYFYGSDAEQLLTRPKELYDGAIPSGNSVAAMNLVRLARLTGNDDIIRLASEQVSAFAGDVALYPQVHAHFMMAVQFLFGPTQEIVIVAPNRAAAQEMVQEVRKHFMPNAVVSLVTDETREKFLLLAPMLTDKTAQDGKATVYVCENFACQAPVTTVEELRQRLT